MEKLKKYKWPIIIFLIIIDFLIANLWSITASAVYTVIILLIYGIVLKWQDILKD